MSSWELRERRDEGRINDKVVSCEQDDSKQNDYCVYTRHCDRVRRRVQS